MNGKSKITCKMLTFAVFSYGYITKWLYILECL